MQDNTIKPEIYTDRQVREAIKELFSYKDFLAGMKGFVPVQLNEHILEEVNSVGSADDFQEKVIKPFLKAVKKSSISNISISGLDNLAPNKSYLFISNHRDIVLDSAYLNLVLLENGMKTSRIAIGDNLIANRLTELVFKINKSFVVKRSGNPRDIYRHAVLLSNYINDTITNNEDSIWIAQREGRAKDGNDRTQVSLLKMMSLTCKGDLVNFFRQLQIVPVSISYEYDPCGFLKTKEYIQKKAQPDYKKSFKQDADHLLLGIQGYKGNLHFHFERPLNERLEQLKQVANPKAQLEQLGLIIDKSIHLNYKLNPVNYFAYDRLTQGSTYAEHYNSEQEKELDYFFEHQIKDLQADQQEMGRYYILKMYANPLINAESYH